MKYSLHDVYNVQKSNRKILHVLVFVVYVACSIDIWSTHTICILFIQRNMYFDHRMCEIYYWPFMPISAIVEH